MNKQLIAESGSTKTEWRLCKADKILQDFRSAGFNPNVQTKETMRETIQEVIYHVGSGNLDEVTFYGAGLAEQSQRQIIYDLLSELLPKARINIEHDMLAAVRSTLQPEGIVCILGTGSNSAMFKGDQITMNLGGHGYLVGDEGSGCNIGKFLLKGLLQHDFPRIVTDYVEEHEKMTINDIKLSTFKAEKPNVRLASLARYAGAMLHVPEVYSMTKRCFADFLEATVCRYPDYQSQTTSFVGSISFFFKDPLMEVCAERNVKVGSIVKDPIDNLVQYHLSIKH
ncbi:MAG: hypothetical protein ACKVTZ_24360 [Bacteroidia bacterium]